MAHSKGDDDRPAELMERLRREDPLTRLLERSPEARTWSAAAAAHVQEMGRSVAARPKLDFVPASALPGSAGAVSSKELHAELTAPVGGYGRVTEGSTPRSTR